MSTNEDTGEPQHPHSPADPAPAQYYEIRVNGHLGTRWETWFDGMAVVAEDDGTSVISGAVTDQAALHGLLQRLRDLGIELVSLTPRAPATAREQPQPTRHRIHHQQPGAI